MNTKAGNRFNIRHNPREARNKDDVSYRKRKGAGDTMNVNIEAPNSIASKRVEQELTEQRAKCRGRTEFRRL